MSTNIAFDIIARDRASSTFNKVGRSADGMGRSTQSAGGKMAKFGALAKVGASGALALTAGLVVVGKGAVNLEREFSKTMSVLQATTKSSGSEMKDLTALAMKMGSETVFSANDASKAMLELARGGMTAAQIQGGALAGTLTLAAAGELEMGEAANVAVKSMGQFNLTGKDSAAIAAALAGGANASSASVRDMSQALSQGGLAANSVGFSLQETTAVLAGFSNAGMQGSDAGTSLKTMLDRLQPVTNSAKAAMMGLGAWSEKTGSAFVKSNGQFKSAAQIAEILKKGTEGLSQAERKRLITQAFGSDAQRAATVFAEEGAAGLGKLLKATSDQGAAEKMAAANMKGTAGAMERLSGAVETAQLKIGIMLAPAVISVADALSEDVIPAMTGFIDGLSGSSDKANKFTPILEAVGGVLRDVGGWIKDDLAPALVQLAGDWLEGVRKGFKNIGDSMKDNKPFIDQVKAAFGVLGDVLTTKLMPALGWVYLHAFPAMGKAIGIAITVLKKLSTAWLFMAEHGIRGLNLLLGAAFQVFGGILAAAEKGMGWIPGLGGKIKKAKDAFDDFRASTVNNLDKTAAALHKTRDAINGIKSPPPVKIKIQYEIPLLPTLPGISTPKLPKGDGDAANARGTGYFRGGRTWVGEEGPELVELPRGSRIHDAARSKKMASGSGSEIDYDRLATSIVRALERGTNLVRLPDAGRAAYQAGAAY